MRQHLRDLILRVLVVHATFIAIYYAAGISRRSVGTQQGFTLLWTLVTVVVVAISLTRIRRARRERFRPPRGPS